VINQSVSVLDPETRTRIELLTNYFLGHGISDPAVAGQKALIVIKRSIRQQADIMAFSDSFFLLGAALVLALAASLFLRKSGPVNTDGAH
jgi:DHA2 family multidrug resistance protein